VILPLSQLVLGILLGNTLTNFMRASAGTREGTTTNNVGGNIMNAVDLIGLLADDDDDDDDVGAIGYDLIGEDDDDDDAVLEALSVSGMGNSELIGAVKKIKKAKAKKKAKTALAKIASKNSGAVIQRDMNRRRRYPLGIVPTSVTTTGNIPAAPQNLFRPERCVIPSDVAFDFGVSDIKVGNTSQFVQNVEVPAALFSEVAINTGVYFDTAEVGNQMSVSVRCKTGVATEFSGAFVGSIAK
jgi:hypothetical protein